MSYPNEVYSAFLFLSFLAVTIPLPWHLQAWNTGTCLYMIWTSIGALNQFINSIVWNGNAINWNPIWCDISAKIWVGMNFAIPAASLCINRRLYYIASVTTVTVTKKEKLRGVMIDLAIGVGIPVLGMATHYVNQGHRFDIYEDVGCFPFTYNTPMYYGLQVVPMYLIAIASAVYCVLSIRAFNQRRVQRKQLLATYSNLNANRYFRLMALAGCDLLLTIPAMTWATVTNIKIGVSPWISWEDTHWGFSKVDQYPALIWRSTSISETAIETSRWSIVVCAFIFFALFGFADEARKNYRLAYDSIAKRVGYTTIRSSTTGNSTVGKSGFSSSSKGRHLPVFIRQETRSRYDTTVSDVSFNDAGGALDDCRSIDEKRLTLVIPDGNNRDSALIDHGKELYTPSPSSASTSSMVSPSDADAVPLPEPVALRVDRHVEISSVRRTSSVYSMEIPAVKPAHQDASNNV